MLYFAFILLLSELFKFETQKKTLCNRKMRSKENVSVTPAATKENKKCACCVSTFLARHCSK